MDTQLILGIVVAAVAIWCDPLDPDLPGAEAGAAGVGASQDLQRFGRVRAAPQRAPAAGRGDEHGREARDAVLDWIQAPGRQELDLMDPSTRTMPGFPHGLLPQRSCMVAEDMRVIAETLARAGYVGHVSLIGFYRDQEDNEYMARPWEFEINEWLRQAG